MPATPPVNGATGLAGIHRRVGGMASSHRFHPARAVTQRGGAGLAGDQAVDAMQTCDRHRRASCLCSLQRVSRRYNPGSLSGRRSMWSITVKLRCPKMRLTYSSAFGSRLMQ